MQPFVVAALGGLLAFGGVAASADAAQYRVGVGRSDLTWHVGGEPQRDQLRFDGVQSRLHAKAIVVQGRRPFAFVRADILLVTGDLYAGVAQRVQRATGIPPERLLVAATHTHTANNGLYPHAVHAALYRSFDPHEREFLASRIAAAVIRASRSARPARLAAGSGAMAVPDFNRRYTDREALRRPPFANDPSRLDPEVGVMRFDDARTGRPIAVFMNHGIHPVVVIDEPLLSSDIVGFAERRVEQAMTVGGHRPMAIWFTGAQGDQDPVHVRMSYPEAEWVGDLYGREVVRVARRLRARRITRAGMTDKLIPLPPPGTPLETTAFAGPRVPVAGPASLLIPSSVRLQAISLGTKAGSTALVSWPGEPIRDLGVSLKQQVRALGFRRAWVLALSNDWGGYWLTPREYDRGMYEAGYHFYGRESALYVMHHAVDLARSLATGIRPEQVPLPPQAVLDREETAALAAHGAGEDPEPPPPDLPARALSRPRSVERLQVASFEWRGGSPDVRHGWIPHVYIERRARGRWRDVAREGTGAVLLSHASPAPGDNRWTARWEPTVAAPTGKYRFRVTGRRQGAGSDVPYRVSSAPFAVSRCRCVLPVTVRMRFRTLSVVARYRPASGAFRFVPRRVRSGRAVVAAVRRGRVVARIRLRFHHRAVHRRRTVSVRNLDGRTLPVTITETVEGGRFRAHWSGRLRGTTFRVVRVRDASRNVWR